MRLVPYLFVVGLLIAPFMSARAAPLDDVVNECSTDADPPEAKHTSIKMPDGKQRGTRNSKTLTGEARKAKARGDCAQAVQWLLHCAEDDEDAKKVLLADPQATCGKL